MQRIPESPDPPRSQRALHLPESSLRSASLPLCGINLRRLGILRKQRLRFARAFVLPLAPYAGLSLLRSFRGKRSASNMKGAPKLRFPTEPSAPSPTLQLIPPFIVCAKRRDETMSSGSSTDGWCWEKGNNFINFICNDIYGNLEFRL